jgi:hypothetical protein
MQDKRTKWQKDFDRNKKDQQIAEWMLRKDKVMLHMIEAMLKENKEQLKKTEFERMKYILSDKYEKELGDYAVYYRLRICDDILFGKQIQKLNSAVRNLEYTIRKIKNNNRSNTDWQGKYEHATRDVRIEDVVRHFCMHKGSFAQNVKCPLHDDKTGSMKVYGDSNSFYCFGCGEGGSPVHFVMKLKNCDFKEAVEILSLF